MHSNLNIAVVIPWSINRDSRARRTIKEMSNFGYIDVFYIPISDKDKTIEGSYSENVSFHPLRNPKLSLYYKFIQHSFFYLKYSYFIKYILSKNIKYNIVYIHDLVSGKIGITLKKKLKCNLIYDIHDLYLETLNQQFPVKEDGKMNFKHALMYKSMLFFGKKFESKLIKISDLIFTVNHSCSEHLKKEYKKEILYFRNFPEYRDKPSSNNKLAKLLNLKKEKKIAIYIGSIAKGRNLVNITKSAKSLDSENVIIIIGSGVLKNELIKITQKNKTLNDKVFFIDSIPYDYLFSTIISAKVGLMILDPINKSKEYALANKISEYLLCGIPALLSNHVEHIKLLKEHDLGYLIKSYNPEDIANHINNILLDTELLNKKSKNARIAFENSLNWKNEKEKFITPFKKLIYDRNN